LIIFLQVEKSEGEIGANGKENKYIQVPKFSSEFLTLFADVNSSHFLQMNGIEVHKSPFNSFFVVVLVMDIIPAVARDKMSSTCS
jgi:hypothetical protein